MKLRPYHNPENIDESLVPDGWRFRYADEMPSFVETKCRAWFGLGEENFSFFQYYLGNVLSITYIVPVNA